MKTDYIVQFMRKDGQPNDEYIYSDKIDAEKHFRLFRNDDSGLYTEVCLLSWQGNDTKLLQKIEFS